MFKQVASRLLLPLTGFVILAVLSKNPETLKTYDLLVTLAPLVLSILFAPDLQYFGFLRAQNAGAKAENTANLRNHLAAKIVLTTAGICASVYFWMNMEDIKALLLMFLFLIPYSLFLFFRSIQHAMMVYRSAVKRFIGFVEVIFSAVLCLVLCLSHLMGAVVSPVLMSGMVGFSSVSAITLTGLLSKKIRRMAAAFLSIKRARSPLIMQSKSASQRWLPTWIFVFSVIYIHIDRFLVFADIPDQVAILLVFQTRVLGIIVMLGTFFSSIYFSPKLYRYAKEKLDAQVNDLRRAYKLVAVAFLFLSGILSLLGVFLLHKTDFMSPENANLAAWLLVLALVKLFVLLWGNLISVLMTAYNRKKVLLSYFVMQSASVAFIMLIPHNLPPISAMLLAASNAFVIALLFEQFGTKSNIQNRHN